MLALARYAGYLQSDNIELSFFCLLGQESKQGMFDGGQTLILALCCLLRASRYTNPNVELFKHMPSKSMLTNSWSHDGPEPKCRREQALRLTTTESQDVTSAPCL